MHRKYKAELFILYLQNFFRHLSAGSPAGRTDPIHAHGADCGDCHCHAAGLYLRSYAKTLRQLQEELERPITLELGLQTPNYRTLANIHRGHTWRNFWTLS